jgi:hypothetical protein
MPSRPSVAHSAWALALVGIAPSAPSAHAEPPARPVDSNEPLSLRITPRVTMAGGGVITAVRVMRSPENRVLSISVDGPGYYSSTDVQLDCEQAAQMHSFRWVALPPGQYVVQVVVERSDRRVLHASENFEVVGQREEPGVP